jgi:hypothetical protein
LNRHAVSKKRIEKKRNKNIKGRMHTAEDSFFFNFPTTAAAAILDML